MTGPLPQDRFTDLYSAVYELIDDAKLTHEPLKLYKGSHAAIDPHEHVLAFGSWFYRTRRGLLGYVCDAAGRIDLEALNAFEKAHRPRIMPQRVFRVLALRSRRIHETDEAYLRYVADRRHPLGAYRGGSSGFDDESRAVACEHFTSLGVACGLDDVLVFTGGAKGVFLAMCAALMCRRVGEGLTHQGGIVLAPPGYYQSLRLMPPLFGGALEVVPELTGPAVADWLTMTSRHPGRIVYVPVVNNLDGKVLERPRARALAAVILAHNAANPSNPVYVIGDDVYVGSYLDPTIVPTPIASVPGMEPWCVSVVTPSKTFALPTGRIAFAATTNPALRSALAHYRTVFSHGRPPQITELTSAAALFLTPQQWVEDWNARYRARALFLRHALEQVNAELGFAAFAVDLPQGGWYVPLRINRGLFHGLAHSSVDAQAVALHYGGGRPGTGLALLPGELFGRDADDGWFWLRGNLAVGDATLTETVARLRDLGHILRLPGGEQAVSEALTRARRAVPHLAATVARRAY